MQGQGAAGFALRAFFVRARRHQKGRQERTKAVELYTVGIHDAGFHPRVKVQTAGWVKVQPAPTVNALIKNARKLPQELYKSLTWDRGTEMHGHKRFTMATDIQVYFCDPQSPWQRGSNENTNGLLRQYMPKGIDISGYSQLQLNAIARQLNERPRKTLGFHTPAEMFSECVALTG